MKILDVYIGKYFLKFFLIVLAVPGILFSFFELLSQLESVGHGAYSTGNAVWFVLLTLPGRLQDLMPMTVLLAGIIALGMLADRHELLSMEASGMSVLRISTPVLVTCLILMLISAGAGEMLIPQFEQKARNMRFHALSSGNVTPVKQGFWARFHNSFIHTENVGEDGTAAGISIFRFNRNAQMKSFIHADIARISNEKWILNNVTQKTVRGTEITTHVLPFLELDGFLSTEQVKALEISPMALSTPELLQYISALEKSGQNAGHYKLALWQKISLPLTTAAMALLSLTFVFGPIREMGAGLRITVGAFAGIALYFGQQLVTHIGTFLGLPAFVTAMIPAVAVGMFAAVRMKRLI